MPINTKKPAMKQTVGAQYMCFADATEGISTHILTKRMTWWIW